MARVWKAGGQELHEDQIPFAVGSDQYYRYVADWRAKALGISYGGTPFDLENKEAYEEGLEGWWKDQFWQVKNMDRSAQVAQGYGWTPGPSGQGAFFYDMDGDGQQDPTEQLGKYGGAGALNPGKAADNRWNDLDGYDVRTDQQKFYDRELDGYEQVADANGTYNWYANWSYRDKDGGTQKSRVNLTHLGTRDGRDDEGKNIVGSDDKYARDADADWSGTDYHLYNDAPDKAWFDDQVRNRKNVSPYARTA